MNRTGNIPIVDLSREYSLLKKDINQAIKDCLSGQLWVLGPQVDEFEKKAAEYLKVRYALGVASGTDALILSLSSLALKIKGRPFFDKQDEIITTPFSFIATAEAIVRAGARPVFVDIDYDTCNISPAEIKKAINKKTVGILPVHLYGLSCEIKEIAQLAKKNGLFVLEDVAQAFGAEYKGKKCGCWGDAGAFSFFPSKNLGCYGDGGLVVTNDRQLADNIKALRNHGQRSDFTADYIGYNSRLDSIQASMLLIKLKHLDKLNERRCLAAKINRDLLGGIASLRLPVLFLNKRHVYNLYTVRVLKDRDRLLKFLNAKGVGARVYYPLALNDMPAFQKYKTGKFINLYNVLKEVLTLPVHPFLTVDELNYIARTIKLFYRIQY